MKSQFISHVRTAAILGFGILSSYAQDVPPTSVELSKTFTPIFKTGKIEKTIDADKEYANFRFIAEYDAKQAAYLILRKGSEVELPAGKNRKIEVTYEHSGDLPARYRVWVDGLVVEKGRDIPNSQMGKSSMTADATTSSELVKLDKDYTMMVEFSPDKKGGGLFSKTLPNGNWEADSKALYVKNNKLVYELAEAGKIESKTALKAGTSYVAVVTSESGRINLYLNGNLEGTLENSTTKDPKHPVFQIGMPVDKLTDYFKGNISIVRYWGRALNAEEIAQLSKGKAQTVNTPDFNWAPVTKESVTATAGEVPGHAIVPQLEILAEFEMHRAVIQPLAASDHQELVKAWGKKNLESGKTIYTQLCVTCHGTLDQPGSLPTAPRFHLGDLKNGADPYRMLQTLEKGYGQMTAMPQYSTAEKYDVIHYIREEFMKGKNEKYYTALDADYLASLPRGMSQLQAEAPTKKYPQYLLQDYGNTLFWTLQVAKDNIAQKGLAIRLDEGTGGISKGKAWMLYEHDTMRVAAIWTGNEFVNWKGIAFDGSHGSHTSIAGETHFSFPDQPAWANPETGDFKDLRILGRDNRPYGPLPRSWVHFKGLETQAGNPVIRYTIGDCEIRETPKLAGENVFERWFYCGPSSKELKLRLDENQVHVLPPSKTPFQFGIRYQAGKVEVFKTDAAQPAAKPTRRFEKILTTQIKNEPAEGAWAVDTFELPEPKDNPWQSWMRTTGFDFFEGGKSAAVCTWNGEVWIVDGIDQSQGELKWQLICAGLFQPLGLKIRDGQIFVSCRDMIALLHDHNGDRETDYIESFNSDHQVTEHFHEFAMGLQTDAEGNFYYAKSARHAKTAVVPHHGTLLKVSKDGSKTDILATGFRAANGVCLNPDGSFMVTDQEGNWMPKNRINWVKPKGDNVFYGNMWGYHAVTDESEAAMKQPLCWITNSFDRSPAELLWVPETSAWKPLHGSLLNLSYGEGKIYTVPFEKQGDEVQGGMSPLGLKPMPSGLMRGRFSPVDGQLYGCGMFAWAGNRQQPGGFYRIRYTGQPAHQPVALSTQKGKVSVGFSDPLDPKASTDLSAWQVRAWDLKRTSGYGSKHLNERDLKISKAEISPDGKTITLDIPDLAPTWGMSIKMKLRGANGNAVDREINNSIFTLD